MTCNFNSECTANCPKYPMCAYYAIQKQISDINEQIGFIYKTLGKLSEITLNVKNIPTINVVDFENNETDT